MEKLDRKMTGFVLKDSDSNTGRDRYFLFTFTYIPALSCTQPHMQWATGFFPSVKEAGAQN